MLVNVADSLTSLAFMLIVFDSDSETPRPVLMNFIKMAKAKFLAAHARTEESLADDDQDLIIQQAQTDYDDACDAWKQSHAPSSAGSSGGSGQSPIQPSKPMKFYLTEGQKYLEFYRAHTRWHEDTDGDKSNVSPHHHILSHSVAFCCSCRNVHHSHSRVALCRIVHYSASVRRALRGSDELS